MNNLASLSKGRLENIINTLGEKKGMTTDQLLSFLENTDSYKGITKLWKDTHPTLETVPEEAVMKNDVKSFSNMFENGEFTAKSIRKKGNYMIYLASAFGSYGILEYLFDKVGMTINDAKIYDCKMLRVACKYGKVESVRFFHEKLGMTVDDFSSKDNNCMAFTVGKGLFNMRCSLDKLEKQPEIGDYLSVLKYLKEKLGFTKENLSGCKYHVVNSLVLDKDIEMVEYLYRDFDAGSDKLFFSNMLKSVSHNSHLIKLFQPVCNFQKEDLFKSKIVSSLIRNNLFEDVKYICENFEITKEEFVENCISCFHTSCELGHTTMIKFLCSYFDIQKEEFFNESTKPLMIVCQSGNLETLSYIHERFQPTKKEYLTFPNNCLFAAALHGKKDIVEFIYSKYSIDKENVMMKNGMLIQNLCKLRYTDILKCICEKTHLTAKNFRSNGGLALKFCCQYNSVDIVRYVRKRFDLDKQDALNSFPIALSHCRFEIMKMFHRDFGLNTTPEMENLMHQIGFKKNCIEQKDETINYILNEMKQV